MNEQIVSFRVGLYEAIRRTAEQQHQAVAADDLDRFYDLLQERERLLEKAESVKQQLGEGDRARAGQVVADILRLDQETERLLMGKIEDVRGELGDMTVGRQAVAAYGRVTPLR
jgi:hypothetical protein